jgi:hypothetical protein
MPYKSPVKPDHVYVDELWELECPGRQLLATCVVCKKVMFITATKNLKMFCSKDCAYKKAYRKVKLKRRRKMV